MLALALSSALALAQGPVFGSDIHRMLPPSPTRARLTRLVDLDGDGGRDAVLVRPLFEGGPVRRLEVLLNESLGRFAAAPVTQIDLPDDVTALAEGDVDADGDLDLVLSLTGPAGAQNRLLSNLGGGVLQDATANLPALADATRSLALADVDGDGDLDVLFGNEGQDRLLSNDGSGAFSESPGKLPPLLGITGALLAADLDGDGDIDALAGEDSGQGVPLHLYVNLGGGAFGHVPQMSFPALVRGLVAADVDGDLDLDVFALTGQASGPPVTRLLLNDGGGMFSFPPGQAFPTSATTQSVGLVAGDLDGDLDVDLWVARLFQGHIVLRNQGNGSFLLMQTFPLLHQSASIAGADVDGDQDVDVLVDGRRLLLNDGVSGFLDVTQDDLDSASLRADRLELFDADADGDLDCVTVYDSEYQPGSYNRLLVNDGAGRFELRRFPQLDTFDTCVAVGDLDLDGDPDLLVGAQFSPNFGGGQERLFLNQEGTFVESPGWLPQPPEDDTFDLVLVDVEGDGDLDALALNDGYTFGWSLAPTRLFRNLGGGSYQTTSGAIPHILGGHAAAAGDVDLDGDADLLVGRTAGFTGLTALLWSNDGTGSFQDSPGQVPALTLPVSDVALGDLDADGDPDAYLGLGYQNSGGQDRLWLNDGVGLYTDASQQLPQVVDIVRSLRLVDPDQDGDLDVLVVRVGGLKLLVNDGAATFSDGSARLPQVSAAVRDAVLQDVDGDGDPDLISVHNDFGSTQHRNLARQVAWRTLPRAGKPLQMEVYGPPGEPFVLLASTALAEVPLPPLGVLRVDRATLVLELGGSLGPDGHAVVRPALPGASTSLGSTLYWQALVGTDPRLSNMERTTFLGL